MTSLFVFLIFYIIIFTLIMKAIFFIALFILSLASGIFISPTPLIHLLLAQHLQVAASNSASASTDDWKRAFNAALVRVVYSGKFLELKTQYEIEELGACFTCAPNPDTIPFPPASSATGRLKTILETRNVTISGYVYKDLPAGDYTVTPAVGFWPDYFEAIMDELRAEYGPLNTNRLLFTTSNQALDAVATGVADISELYYVIGGTYNNRIRIEAFDIPCTAGSYESSAFTSVTSNINSMKTLVDYINRGENVKVGVMSMGDFNAVQAVLPHQTVPVVIVDHDQLKESVVNGTLAAAITSTRPAEDPLIQVFTTGVISPRAGFIGRSDGLMSSTIIMSVFVIVGFVMFAML